VAAAGVETPRCLLHESDPSILDGAFLLLEWVEAGAILQDATISVLDRRRRIRSWWTALGSAPEILASLPVQLADAALRVATVDGAAVEQSIRERGGKPEFLSVDERLR
jgi:hypothetical protein